MFSDPMMALLRRHLGWASEQSELFERLVPPGVTDADFDAGTVTRSGVTLQADLLGTFAANGTWLWAWGNDSFEDATATDLCWELADLDEAEGVPEFEERLLDFSHYPDPRQMAYRLTMACMAVAGGRGAIVYAHNARGRTFMITRDPAVPLARPRATTLEGLLTGDGYVPGPVEEAVRGYFDHYGLDATYGNGQAEALYPSGNRAVVTYETSRLLSVQVTGPQGAAPLPEPAEDPALGTPETSQIEQAVRLFPEPLLGLAAQCLAWSIRWREGFNAQLGGTEPTWTGDALRFGDATVPGRLLGIHDLEAGTWEWADSEVPSRIASEINGESPVELAATPLNLTPYAHPEATIRVLAEVAAHVLKADGVLEIHDEPGRRHFVAIEDAWPLGQEDITLETIPADIAKAAETMHPLTPTTARERTMYDLVVWGFQRFGLVPNVALFYEERWIGGEMGLYEIRASFAPTGDIIDTGIYKIGSTDKLG